MSEVTYAGSYDTILNFATSQAAKDNANQALWCCAILGWKQTQLVLNDGIVMFFKFDDENDLSLVFETGGGVWLYANTTLCGVPLSGCWEATDAQTAVDKAREIWMEWQLKSQPPECTAANTKAV
jgi:hypothetical protein